MHAFTNLTENTSAHSEGSNITSDWSNNGMTTVLHEDDDDYVADVVSDEFRLTVQLVNFVFICEIIDLFGTGTNIINIVCIVKQGFRDSVNISLLGLTISDLLCVVTLIWHNISLNPLLYYSDIPFDSWYTVYLTAGVPHIGFTRVTSWITAFITLERCLCIALPLKIKIMITPKRVTIIIISIFLIIFTGNIAPIYYCTRFIVKKHPFRINRTWISIGYTQDRRIVDKYSFAINNCFLPFTAFTVISISTVVLVVQLRSKTKWRKKSATQGKSDSLSSRDQTVSKMVVMISTVFIVCYTPVCVIFIAMIVEPMLAIDGGYGNMFAVVFSFAYILESVNASFNIFIYYKMSSRFRAALREVLCLDSNKDKEEIIKTSREVGI